MWLPAVLFLVGVVLSGLFSGTETGLYRVPRTRLVLDALGGSQAARAMVWLLNHPAIYVATMLVGNNIANYLTSFAVVWAVALWLSAGSAAELLGTMMMTPIVFVFGELLPKYLFFQAPYRLLRLLRPFLLTTTVLFAPITSLLGLLGNALRLLTGQTPFQLRLAMARGELDQVLRAGHEAGILEAGQRSFAQRIFEIGNLPAIAFGTPQDRCAIVDLPLDADQARYQARRQNQSIVLVRRSGRIVGFVRYADLSADPVKVETTPVVRARLTDRHLKILLQLYDAESDVAVLCDDRNNPRAIVTRRQLLQPLIK